MTEKRYVEELWAYDDIMVKDNETGEELWNNMIYERMNEQDKEIMQLKKEIKYLQSELHNATFNIRKETLKEVKLEIEKLERWE